MIPDPAPGSPPGPPPGRTSQPAGAGPLPRHLLADTAEIGPTGRLSVGGVDVLDLCAELGTPVFVYDEEHLRARCREAVAAWGSGATYASKAFWCRAMARLAAEEGLAVDVSTGGELHVGLAGGVPPERMVLHGNNKSEAELAAALECGVGRIVVDSFDEIDRLERLVPAAAARRGRPVRPRALVRVTPGVEAHTHEYVRTGQEDSKFGFGLASGAAAAAVARLRGRRSPVEVVGLHVHIGSQIFALDSFARALALLAPFAVQLDLPELSVGGGLGVGYVDGEPTPGIRDWAATVRAAVGDAGWP
ncbi:MAG: diaminopimelate decarboxylase family protein, partial [Acidimicrobiales bacterium]